MSDVTPSPRVFNVLFLCTHNSARSVFAEAAMNRIGKGRFRAFSAGSHPSGQVHPRALKLLSVLGYDTSGICSKSWDEFAVEGAPRMDFVFTVCDDAAAEVCPIWPGQPMTAHWGVEDPSRVEGTEAEKSFAFMLAHRVLRHRIELFMSLPIASIERISLQRKIDDIGRNSEAPEEAPETDA